jgi:hypothetical protein
VILSDRVVCYYDDVLKILDRWRRGLIVVDEALPSESRGDGSVRAGYEERARLVAKLRPHVLALSQACLDFRYGEVAEILRTLHAATAHEDKFLGRAAQDHADHVARELEELIAAARRFEEWLDALSREVSGTSRS